MCVVQEAINETEKRKPPYMHELLHGFEWKAAVAASGAWLAGKYLGSWDVLYIWFFFMAMDCATGWWKAVVLGVFEAHKLRDWVGKLAGHLTVIAGLNMLMWSLAMTSGEPNGVINWVVFFFTITEAISCVNNCVEAGYKPPDLIMWLLLKVRKKSLMTLANTLGDGDISDAPEVRKHRKGDRRKGRSSDTGHRRRITDDSQE